MSKIIPELTEEQILSIPSVAEQKVYRKLKIQIPNDWLVIHSLEYIMMTSRYKSHGDREADFVLFSPNHGILVVEVKGGGIEYDGSSNTWYSIDRNNSRNKIKNPLKQAKDAKYEIRRHLNKKLMGKKLLLAHAALFPDIRNLTQLITPAVPKEILGNNINLQNLKDWVISIFDYFAGEQPIYDPLMHSGVSIAEKVYGNSIKIEPSLSLIIEDDIKKQIELTNRQKNILRQLKRRKDAVIEGGAGTGKTLLALDHARNLACQGLKVLLLCYNQKLGNFLKIQSQGVENLHSMSFHEFCSWRLKQVTSDTGRDLIEESKLIYPYEDYFDVIMPNALIESYDISSITYDVIIVDEAQDFKEEYWLAIELLKQENTKLYIFKDSNQAIYCSNVELPVKSEPLFLFDNCRNTQPIHELAYKFYDGESIEPPSIAGSSVSYLVEDNQERQVKLIDKEISNLINKEHILPKDIALVIMNNYDDAESLLKQSKNHHIWAFKDYSPESRVLVETVKRFKGLEANIIFLWILDDTIIDNTLLYIASSRARARLYVVGSGKFIEYLKNYKQ